MAKISGGANLEKALAVLADKIAKPATLRVGFLAGATYPDGKPVAMIAAIQEFGAPRAGIPPRPFFRNMIAAKSREWGPALAADLKTTMDVDASLKRLGAGIQGQLQQSIRDTDSPPLARSTSARKGHDKPLVDTGHMLNSVDYEIES